MRPMYGRWHTDWIMKKCDEGMSRTQTTDPVDWVWAIRAREQEHRNYWRLAAYINRRAGTQTNG